MFETQSNYILPNILGCKPLMYQKYVCNYAYPHPPGSGAI